MSKIPTVQIGGKAHRLVVLRVEAFDENGVPQECSVLLDDGVAELSRDERDNHFILAWIPAVTLLPRPSLGGYRSGGGA
ncbi:MAG: hypothetical protein WAZ94_13345 [Phycisphaerales bacterium]